MLPTLLPGHCMVAAHRPNERPLDTVRVFVPPGDAKTIYLRELATRPIAVDLVEVTEVAIEKAYLSWRDGEGSRFEPLLEDESRPGTFRGEAPVDRERAALLLEADGERHRLEIGLR